MSFLNTCPSCYVESGKTFASAIWPGNILVHNYWFKVFGQIYNFQFLYVLFAQYTGTLLLHIRSFDTFYRIFFYNLDWLWVSKYSYFVTFWEYYKWREIKRMLSCIGRNQKGGLFAVSISLTSIDPNRVKNLWKWSAAPIYITVTL